MKFGALTGLRGVCAIIVAISHLSVIGWIAQSPIIGNSYLFVDFFFVLSGFVIGYAYLDRLDGRVTMTAFMVRRFGRLFPLHLAVLAVMFAAESARYVASCFCVPMETTPFTDTTSLPTLVSNLVLAQSLGIHAATSWNFPSWSISVEFYTYILFAAVAVMTVSLKASARIGVLVAIMAAAALVPITYSHSGMFVTSDYGLYRCIYGFFAGVLTLIAWRRSQVSNPAAKSMARERPLLSAKASATIAELLCVVLVVAFVLMAGTGKLSFAAPIVFCAAVFVLADDAGPISAFLRSPVMRYLGDRSYSIYMVHSFLALQIIQRAVGGLARFVHLPLMQPHVNDLGESSMLIDFGNPLLGDALTAAYIGTVIVIAHFSYSRVEVPWRAWFNGVADRYEARHGKADGAVTPAEPQLPTVAGSDA